MRVRATDPRPCPKCGKIYRSAHTLRTHLEDKHTVCPGYRCVLCGTVAKSRNSLHSHMSRQHRGISTKDLPVLPMPSAFDPELASRLLAKAGVKISAAELRARASPTGSGAGGTCVGGNGNNGTSGGGGGIIGSNNTDGNQAKLSIGGGNGMHDDGDESDDDPEDLTTGAGLYGNHNSPMVSGNDLSRYHESLLSNFGQHANTTISRIRNEAAAAAAAAATLGQQHQKELNAGAQIPTTTATPGQSLLDTYLQFITENTFGMGMSQEHAAAAALHAAKMAQLNAMGHSLDKIPAPLLQPQFDLSKLGASAAAAAAYMSGSPSNAGSGVVGGLTIEPVFRRGSDPNCPPPNSNGPTTALASDLTPAITVTANSNTIRAEDLRHDDAEPMNLGLDSGNNAQMEGSNEGTGIGNSGIGGASIGSSNNNNNTNIAELKEDHKYNVDESSHHA